MEDKNINFYTLYSISLISLIETSFDVEALSIILHSPKRPSTYWNSNFIMTPHIRQLAGRMV